MVGAANLHKNFDIDNKLYYTINLNYTDPIDRPYRRSLFISPHYP